MSTEPFYQFLTVQQTIETRTLDFSRAGLTEVPDLTLIGNAGAFVAKIQRCLSEESLALWFAV
jgi:hypothetical protein